VQLFIFLPVLLYAVVVIGVAIYAKEYLSALYIVFYLSLLCVFPAWLLQEKTGSIRIVFTIFYGKVFAIHHS
jgi:hypothetical protein